MNPKCRNLCASLVAMSWESHEGYELLVANHMYMCILTGVTIITMMEDIVIITIVSIDLAMTIIIIIVIIAILMTTMMINAWSMLGPTF